MLPPWPARRHAAFEELSRRRGDFAMAGVAVGFELDVCLVDGGGTRCANDITTTTAAR